MGLKALKSISFALVATFLWAGTASAARPTTVANTTWVLQTSVKMVRCSDYSSAKRRRLSA